MLTDYTTYDEIRAVLGVSTDELEDEVLALPLYASHLQGELEDVALALPSAYIAVITIPEASRTDVQQRFALATALFSAYAVAKQLSASLPLFSPKDITEGKASVARFGNDPYKVVIAAVQKDYDRLRMRLNAAYAAQQSLALNVTARSYLSVAVPGNNPVTGGAA